VVICLWFCKTLGGTEIVPIILKLFDPVLLYSALHYNALLYSALLLLYYSLPFVVLLTNIIFLSASFCLFVPPEVVSPPAVEVSVISHHMQRYAVWFGGSMLTSTVRQLCELCIVLSSYTAYHCALCSLVMCCVVLCCVVLCCVVLCCVVM
jgi:hypothetical protein